MWISARPDFLFLIFENVVWGVGGYDKRFTAPVPKSYLAPTSLITPWFRACEII